MTDLTYPSEAGGALRRHHASQAIGKAGGHTGYVVVGPDISRWESSLDEDGVNAFASSMSGEGLDLTVDGGEAFINGWLCRDRQTTVSVPAGETSTIYVGFNLDAVLGDDSPGESENVIIDTDAGFSDADPQLPIYEVAAGTSSISSVTDVRPLGRENASAPWVDIETVDGPFTVQSDAYRDHLHLERPGVADWHIGPTTNGNGGIEIERQDADSTFRFTGDNNLYFGEEGAYAVQSSDSLRIEVGEDESSAGDYDIFFEVR